MKNLRLHNVSPHRNFYQNQFIIEYAKKKKAKISKSRSFRVKESQSFLVRYRGTYVLNNQCYNLPSLTIVFFLQSDLPYHPKETAMIKTR